MRLHRGLLTFAGVFMGVAALLAVGLRVRPAPFPAVTGNTVPPRTVPLPAGLPPPVERYFRVTYGERVPVVHSAVISGRAWLRPVPGGPTLPGRFRFIHEAGRNYRHYIEVTLFGWPVMRVHEVYLDGHSRMETPLGSNVDAPKVEQAANLALWAEAIWMPAVFLTDARVRWEAVTDDTARLVVPFGGDEERFTVRFDPQSGRPQTLEALRYKAADSPTKTRWLNDVLAWGDFGGTTLPRVASVTWADDGRPWATFTVEDVVNNVDVRSSLRGRGP
ncbi:DUF6544 family protein [Deinococcus sp. YIM 134068]|uniref:DUF6544 family protein n=1 Tax=Deinococcus lichenicola TaxID=3118910 RepID=UPI002F937290